MTQHHPADERDSGCRCQACGWRYRMDLMLPDEIWDRIHSGMNLLCPSCIVARVEAELGFSAFELKEIGGMTAMNHHSADVARALATTPDEFARLEGSEFEYRLKSRGEELNDLWDAKHGKPMTLDEAWKRAEWVIGELTDWVILDAIDAVQRKDRA